MIYTFIRMKKIFISFFVASILLMQSCADENTEETDDSELTDTDDPVAEDPNDDTTDVTDSDDDASDDSEDSEGNDEDSSTGDDNEPKPVLPQGQVNKILKAHNDARAEVGVAPLKWSEKVARSARKWAKKMAKDHPGDLVHSDRSFRNNYGENLSWGATTATGTVMTPQAAVKLWNDEKADYDYESNTCSAVCGHYTQVVWADSKKVGCATVTYRHNGMRHQVWVCQYDPAGNFNGRRPY